MDLLPYADFNLDGSFTIGDVWLWTKWLLFLPGNLLGLALIEPSTIGLREGSTQGVRDFLEIDDDWYYGFWPGLISAIAWFYIIGYSLAAVYLFLAVALWLKILILAGPRQAMREWREGLATARRLHPRRY